MTINKSERGQAALIVIDVQVNVVKSAYKRDEIVANMAAAVDGARNACLLYTSPSPRDYAASRMPSSA